MCIGSLVARIAAPGWPEVPVLLVSELLVPVLLVLELPVMLVLELIELELLVSDAVLQYPAKPAQSVFPTQARLS